MFLIKIAVTAFIFAVVTYLPIKWQVFKDYDEDGYSKQEMIFGLITGGLVVISVITFMVGIWVL